MITLKTCVVFMRLFHFLFPNNCILCDLETCEQIICSDCFSSLPHHQNGCPQCGLTLCCDKESGLCGQCINHPPPFDRTFALFNYTSPISTMIAQLKFHNKLVIAKWFSHFFISYFEKNNIEMPSLILPVPLHTKRLKERGFNQSLLIAKHISKYFGIPIDIKSCKRNKNTQAQATLSAKKRKDNLKNAFTLSKPTDCNHVAIVDDVMTTGQTISEISALLKSNGVNKVDVWVCARA